MKFDAAFVLSFLIGIPGARPAPLADVLVRADTDTPLATRYIKMAITAFPQVDKTHPEPPSPSEDGGKSEANSKTEQLVVIKEKTVYSKPNGSPNPDTLVRREDNDARSSRGCIIPYPTSDQPETELEANSDLLALVQTLKRIDGEIIEQKGEPRRRGLETAFDGHLAASNDSLTDGAVLQRRIISSFPLTILFNLFKKFEKKQEKRKVQQDGPLINDKDLADIKQLILEIAANHFPESLEEVSQLLLSGNDNSADGLLTSRDDSELDGFIINKPSIFTVALIECVECYIEKLSSTESTAEQQRRPLRRSESPTEANQTELEQLLGDILEDHLPEDQNGLSKLLPRDVDGQVAKLDNAIERRNPVLVVLGVVLSWTAFWAVLIPVTSTKEPAKTLPGFRRDLEVNPLGGVEPVFDANFTHLVLESLENTSQEEIDRLLNLTVYDSGNMRPALNHDLTLLLESLKNMSLADTEKLLDPAAYGVNDSTADAVIQREEFNFSLPVIELSGFVAWITMEYAKKNPVMTQRRDLALFGGQGEQARGRLMSEVEPLLLSLGELSPEELDELIKRLPNNFSAEDRAVIEDFIFKTAHDALDRKGSE
ncbi:hypothetical protein F5X68DRAFT_228025 [Plectosphaerella plurivora]|uniref:Uncharacterized protein n=1 Tax=Plectosphaerella plurivora TaxID=936078 RepID=A0A9P8VIB2_9PEZI|nr:hypothetical protein F5X68DRAFT_228025 [Plectosphaerella plurivora]